MLEAIAMQRKNRRSQNKEPILGGLDGDDEADGDPETGD
jgi:hypothetical protein